MLEFGKWRRGARGLTAEIGWVEPADVVRALQSLPAHWAPYGIVGVAPEQVARGRFGQRVTAIGVSELELHINGGGWKFYIWSSTLSPWVSSLEGLRAPEERAEATLSINGLVHVFYQRQLRAGSEPTVVGCVNRVLGMNGVKITHLEYSSIYKSLVNSLRRSATASPPP